MKAIVAKDRQDGNASDNTINIAAFPPGDVVEWYEAVNHVYIIKEPWENP